MEGKQKTASKSRNYIKPAQFQTRTIKADTLTDSTDIKTKRFCVTCRIKSALFDVQQGLEKDSHMFFVADQQGTTKWELSESNHDMNLIDKMIPVKKKEMPLEKKLQAQLYYLQKLVQKKKLELKTLKKPKTQWRNQKDSDSDSEIESKLDTSSRSGSKINYKDYILPAKFQWKTTQEDPLKGVANTTNKCLESIFEHAKMKERAKAREKHLVDLCQKMSMTHQIHDDPGEGCSWHSSPKKEVGTNEDPTRKGAIKPNEKVQKISVPGKEAKVNLTCQPKPANSDVERGLDGGSHLLPGADKLASGAFELMQAIQQLKLTDKKVLPIETNKKSLRKQLQAETDYLLYLARKKKLKQEVQKEPKPPQKSQVMKLAKTEQKDDRTDKEILAKNQEKKEKKKKKKKKEEEMKTAEDKEEKEKKEKRAVCPEPSPKVHQTPTPPPPPPSPPPPPPPSQPKKRPAKRAFGLRDSHGKPSCNRTRNTPQKRLCSDWDHRDEPDNKRRRLVTHKHMLPPSEVQNSCCSPPPAQKRRFETLCCCCHNTPVCRFQTQQGKDVRRQLKGEAKKRRAEARKRRAKAKRKAEAKKRTKARKITEGRKIAKARRRLGREQRPPA